MEFPVCFLSFSFSFMCLMVFSIPLSTFLLLLVLFVSCCCVPNCVLCFFYAATITAAVTAAVFLYLFIKRLCVCMCVSFYYLLCVLACVQVTHFILLFLSLSFFFFVYYKLPNLFTTYKENKPTVILSSFFSLSLFCVLVCSYLHGCCVCVWFLFLLIIVGFLDTYTLYICMCVMREYHHHHHR